LNAPTLPWRLWPLIRDRHSTLSDALQSLFGDDEGGGGPPGDNVVHTLFVDDVDDRAARDVIDHLEAATAPLAVAQLRVLGGAMAHVPAEATAFAHRARRIMVTLTAFFPRPEDRGLHQTWVDGFAAALGGGGPGAYVNFLADEGTGRVREAYPGATWDRLVDVKRRYDPDGAFPRLYDKCVLKR
jgi:FAD/FMN-containing dehydrogenase